MQMIYESDDFVVVQTDANALPDGSDAPMPRHVFEIVNKHSTTGIMLADAWSEIFQEQIKAWAKDTPAQEQVEQALEAYMALSNYALIMH